MIRLWAFRLAATAVARPWRTLAAAAAITLAAVPGLLRLELRTDGRALFSPDDPAVLQDAEIRGRFGLRDPFVVFIESGHPDGVYNLATLESVRRMTEALSRLDGIGREHVMSLATERRDRVYPGTFDFMPFLEPFPDTPERMAELRGDVEAVGILTGTLVSADRTATTILVGVPPGPAAGSAGSLDRVALLRRIEVLARRLGAPGDRVSVVGAPAAEALLGTHVLEDVQKLLPASLLIIALTIWIACRRFWGVALAMLKVGCCLVWTFGLMGWCGVPVRLTTAVLPVLLTALCLAEEIQLFFRYQRRLARGEDGPHPAALLATLEEMAAPLVLISATTVIGFFAFNSSPLPAVQAFGLFAGLGLLGGMAWSLTVTPAALALLGPGRMARPASQGRVGAVTGRLLSPLVRRPRTTLAALLLLTAVAAAGLPRLHVQDSWVDGFAPGSPFRQATGRANEKLLGTHLLLVQLTLDPPPERIPEGLLRKGPLLDPAALHAIGRFEAYVRGLPGVGGVLGTHSHLTAVSYLWLARRAEARSIPETPERVETLLDRFDMGRGRQRRREVIEDGLRRTLVTVFLKDANYQDTARLMDAIRDYGRRVLEPAGTRLDFAGDVAVSQAMIPAIVRTQVLSLLLALVGPFVLASVVWRSPRAGLLAVVPCSVAILWIFGGMGWAGVPLGVATSMFCAITLGVAVDYSIHLVEEHARLRAAGDPDPVAHAVEGAGPAILADTLTVALGFAPLAFSQVPANAHLGQLLSAALVASCLLTLAGLSAWIAVRERGRGC